MGSKIGRHDEINKLCEFSSLFIVVYPMKQRLEQEKNVGRAYFTPNPAVFVTVFYVIMR